MTTYTYRPFEEELEAARRENAALRDQIAVLTAERPRSDGAPRMSQAQRDKLWSLCAGYNVAFREDDYHPSGKQNGVGHRWYEGWIGGVDGTGITSRRTIYVGVDPEGRAHS
jgi:hypothetical protein